MTRLLYAMFISVCLLGITAAAIGFTGWDSSHHHKLLNPKKDRRFLIGQPPKQDRIWQERVISYDHGSTTAVCLDRLLSQRMFPVTGPTVTGTIFCVGDRTPVGSQESTATVFLSSKPKKHQFRHFVVFKECQIFVSDGTPSAPEVTTVTGSFPLHVITCPSSEGRTIPGLIGQFNTTEIRSGQVAEGLIISGSTLGSEFNF